MVVLLDGVLDLVCGKDELAGQPPGVWQAVQEHWELHFDMSLLIM